VGVAWFVRGEVQACGIAAARLAGREVARIDTLKMSGIRSSVH
jgi:hypothetical protein